MVSAIDWANTYKGCVSLNSFGMPSGYILKKETDSVLVLL